jgi:hypothetical protein
LARAEKKNEAEFGIEKDSRVLFCQKLRRKRLAVPQHGVVIIQGRSAAAE